MITGLRTGINGDQEPFVFVSIGLSMADIERAAARTIGIPLRDIIDRGDYTPEVQERLGNMKVKDLVLGFVTGPSDMDCAQRVATTIGEELNPDLVADALTRQELFGEALEPVRRPEPGRRG